MPSGVPAETRQFKAKLRSYWELIYLFKHSRMHSEKLLHYERQQKEKMATEALKTAYHFTELAVQPRVILQLCKGKDGRDTSQELLTNPLTPKQHASTMDLLGKGTEAHGQAMCCSSLHFHPQTRFPTYIFLHTFWPTSAHSFGLLTFGLSQVPQLIQHAALLAPRRVQRTTSRCSFQSGSFQGCCQQQLLYPGGWVPRNAKVCASLFHVFCGRGGHALVATFRVPSKGAKPQQVQGDALRGEKTEGGQTSRQELFTGAWPLLKAPVNWMSKQIILSVSCISLHCHNVESYTEIAVILNKVSSKVLPLFNIIFCSIGKPHHSSQTEHYLRKKYTGVRSMTNRDIYNTSVPVFLFFCMWTQDRRDHSDWDWCGKPSNREAAPQTQGITQIFLVHTLVTR